MTIEQQDKIRARSREWYANNKDRARARNKIYYRTHRAEIIKRTREYVLDHIEDYKHWLRQWYIANKSKVKVQQARYYIENKEDRLAYGREYYSKNSDKVGARISAWCKTPEGRLIRKAGDHRRRLAESTLTPGTVQQVYEDNIKKYGTLTCCLCFGSIKFGEDCLEHGTPIARRDEYNGDINEYDNLGIAHNQFSEENCNSRKGTKTLQEWFTKGEGAKYAI
jgi:hypothetical protein